MAMTRESDKVRGEIKGRTFFEGRAPLRDELLLEEIDAAEARIAELEKQNFDVINKLADAVRGKADAEKARDAGRSCANCGDTVGWDGEFCDECGHPHFHTEAEDG